MAALFKPRPRSALCHCQRAFSTSIPRSISLQLYRNDPEAVADTVPAYPYGPARWYKQSDLGLYGGQKIRFGNNVGPEFGVKTRRSWHPNIHNQRLWSKALHRPVQVRVSTRVLRTIDKLGGLDEYLLGEKEARIRELGMSGWWLRWAIMQTPAIKRRFAEERERLGISVEQVEQEQREADEASAVISEATEAEVEAATTDGEPVRMDPAFEVESPAGTPALKFRVGPGKHVFLTSRGWARTRPTMPYRDQLNLKALVEMKRRFFKRNQAGIVSQAVTDVRESFGESGREALSEKALASEARRELRKQVEVLAKKQFESAKRRVENERKEKKRKRVERRRAEEERRQREGVVVGVEGEGS